ncbi:MAG: hypothetical protein CMD58_03790 [Gammaproteobacteria bacterium]|nr:hypothetical protein [Gammaproteobacteria bacterium]
MAISKQETQKRFNHSYEDVFKGFCDVIPRIGFKLISNDKTNGVIQASTNISLLSWGENITIYLKKEENSTIAILKSSLKMSTNIFAGDKHMKNFNLLVNALNEHLNTDEMQQNFTIADELRELAALKNEGIITEDEFKIKKAEILNN